MENIRYGRREATDEEVMEAARKAHAHEFIEGPGWLQHRTSASAGCSSGGERQRIAIARAILTNAPILVLDEATSSLDSESGVVDSRRFAGTDAREDSIIVIAHRLSTIMKMDRILVIDDGRVIDSGTHAQLLRKKDNITRSSGRFRQEVHSVRRQASEWRLLFVVR